MSLRQRLLGIAYLAYYVRGQSGYPFRPLAAIEADRDWRVRRMVAYACRYVPYYRETMQRLDLSPGDFQRAEDLARLPILRRDQLQRDPQYFVSTEKPLESYVAARSSGTSGRPCDFFLDAQALYQYAAHDERARAAFAPLLGRSRGYRQTKISSPLGSASRMQRFYDRYSWLPPGIALHRQSLSLLDPPEINARLIDSFQPDVIRSYGSYLAMLFHYLHDGGQVMHLPKVLRFTSDTLPETARNLIETEFRIPVFGTYEATEALNIAFECERHSGMHINIDLCPVRIVDESGRSLPPGRSGAVAVSNLINRGTVFLNYLLDDVATMSASACPCGRTLPLLAELQGRGDDWLELADGRWIHAQAIRTLLMQIGGLWQYQLVQESRSRLSVLLVCSAGSAEDTVLERVADPIASIFGPDVRADIQFVDEVKRTAAGKVRSVTSLCTQGQAPAGARTLPGVGEGGESRSVRCEI